MTDSSATPGATSSAAPRSSQSSRPARRALRAATPAPSRRSSIRTRILTIGLLPSFVLLAIGGITAATLIRQGLRVQEFSQAVGQLSRPSSQLLNTLQQERLTSMGYVSGGSDRAQLGAAYAARDTALADFVTASKPWADAATAPERQGLDSFLATVAELSRVRTAVLGKRISIAAVYGAYNAVLDSWTATLATIARSSPDPRVSTQQMTALATFQAAEGMSRSGALGVAISDEPDLRSRLGATFLRQTAYYHEQLDRVRPQLSDSTRLLLGVLTGSPDWRTTARAEDSLARSMGSDVGGTVATQPGFPVTRSNWSNATGVASHIVVDAYLAESSQAAQHGLAIGRSTLLTSSVGGAAVLLATLLAAVASLRISRRLVVRLRRLRAETLAIADRRLPAIIADLQEGRSVDPATEITLIDHGTDEIGQVAAAFNRAEQAAIKAAVLEAKTRQGIRMVFFNIAHRSQVIVHRQLSVLDELQRSLDDPEKMQSLFDLDHLATRARRNAENLVILSGHRPGRQWRRAVGLHEVVRGAVAEGESYTRVTVTPIPAVWVEGSAVADIIHLLSEIVDNATSFSPPTTQVEVRGGVVARGVAIEVEDRGLGIDPSVREQLNGTLRDAPDFDILALSDDSRLGIFVVARLAARHGISVTLDNSPYGGTRVVVLIPSKLLVQPENDAGAARLEAAAAPAAVPAPSSFPQDAPPRTVSAARTSVRDRGVDTVATRATQPVALTSLVTPGLRTAAESVEQREPGRPTGPRPSSGPRPPLPQRSRQENLAPQLRTEAEPESPAPPVPAAHGRPEDETGDLDRMRSRLSAFQQGTRQGRTTEASLFEPRAPEHDQEVSPR